MNEYVPWLIGVAAAVASWYCYRWGRDDGLAEGYAAGYASGRKDVWADVWNSSASVGGGVSPNAVGGPGAVPR